MHCKQPVIYYTVKIKNSSSFDNSDTIKKALLDELRKLIDSPAFKINMGENDKMLIIVKAE